MANSKEKKITSEQIINKKKYFGAAILFLFTLLLLIAFRKYYVSNLLENSKIINKRDFMQRYITSNKTFLEQIEKWFSNFGKTFSNQFKGNIFVNILSNVLSFLINAIQFINIAICIIIFAYMLIILFNGSIKEKENKTISLKIFQKIFLPGTIMLAKNIKKFIKICIREIKKNKSLIIIGIFSIMILGGCVSKIFFETISLAKNAIDDYVKSKGMNGGSVGIAISFVQMASIFYVKLVCKKKILNVVIIVLIIIGLNRVRCTGKARKNINEMDKLMKESELI